MQKFLDKLKTYEVIPVLIAFFSGYIGQFLGSVVGAVLKVTSGGNSDVIMHPELADAPHHPVFALLVIALINLATIALGGVVAGIMANRRKVDQVVFGVGLFAVLDVFYIFDITSMVGSDIWADWFVALLAVPVGWFAARRFGGPEPTTLL